MSATPTFSGTFCRNLAPSIAIAITLAITSTSTFAQLTGTTMPAAPLISTPTSAPAGPTLTLSSPSTVPATAPTLVLPPIPAPAPSIVTTPATTIPAIVSQAFVGEVSHDHVYVRSGPGVNYYELGQLTKGDLVEVVSSKNGWYAIDPPVGTLCYVAKELVDVDADGKTGTVKGDFVNIRAASLIHPVSDYVVLTVAKKGSKVNIEGNLDKYYKISPPEGVHVYISSQLVAAAPPGAEYATPTLKLPTNFTTVPTTQASTSTAPATQADNTTQPGPGNQVIVVTPQPATAFNSEARTHFAAVNDRTQAEFVKPILQEDLASLITDYQAVLAMPNLPPSVKQSCDERIALVQKRIELQNIAKEAAAPEPPAALAAQQALQQTWQDAQNKIAAAELTAPYVAEGQLRTSEALRSKYVLVNPTTQRVVAYVDPASEIDVSPLLGRYIGVKGIVEITDGVKLVHAKTATLMAEPK